MLCQHLSTLGAVVKTSTRIENLDDLTVREVDCCDATPKQLLRLGERRYPSVYKRPLANFSYCPAAFKVDYALSEPIPWKAPECRWAATLYLGGRFNEIAKSESAVRNGQHAERPFVLLSQPTVFDPSSVPVGKHVA